MAGAEESGRLAREDGASLAWRRLRGAGPTIVFLPGFRSDMEGSKACIWRLSPPGVARRCCGWTIRAMGRAAAVSRMVTIGLWSADALRVIDAVTEGPVILVGSSMGGWIGLNIALARPQRVAGFVGIAAAPDFTERLIWEALAPRERETLLSAGVLAMPSEYGEPTPITLGLIEDGRLHLRLNGPIALDCPVRLLQGQRDSDVPWRTALDIAERVTGDDVRVTLVKDGDHRLSREADLALLEGVVGALLDAP